MNNFILQQQQKEKTDEIEDSVEQALENVKEGASHISRAARYKASVYPIAGAVIGGCLGGPVGFIAGMKLGGLAALSCGFIGKHL
jgi:syntaxin 17